MKIYTTPIKLNKDGTLTCYKFKGIRSWCANCRDLDVDRIVQILRGDLYCADWRSLNDVLEGTYLYCTTDEPDLMREIKINGEKLQAMKETYRVCSLTTQIDSPLMWAFYASEHKGVAIEMRLHCDGRLSGERLDCPQLLPVGYDSEMPVIKLESADLERDVDGVNARRMAQHLLLHKTNHWRYEKEVRLLSHAEHYHLNSELNERIVKVWCGAKIGEEDSIVQKIQKLCPGIEVDCIAKRSAAMFGHAIDFHEKEHNRNENA